jgi:hypothetical protein
VNPHGYYQTPNVNIPLNKRDTGEVASVAIDQLKPYREAANTWPVYRKFEDERSKNKCRVCDQNLWFTTDINNDDYGYTEDQTLSLIIAHIRQCHDKLVTGEEPWPTAETISDSGQL